MITTQIKQVHRFSLNKKVHYDRTKNQIHINIAQNEHGASQEDLRWALDIVSLVNELDMNKEKN